MAQPEKLEDVEIVNSIITDTYRPSINSILVQCASGNKRFRHPEYTPR